MKFPRRAFALVAVGAALSVAGVAAASSDSSGGPDVTVTNFALDTDPAHETVTLPLFKGHDSVGATVWYVVTDSSDENDAARRGINFAPKLANALGTRAVERVRVANGEVEFPTGGSVDFSPTRVVVPDPVDGFPPLNFDPGALGEANYSPLITTGNGVVLNATQVKNATGEHDSITTIDTAKNRVTLKLFSGLWNGHRTLYLHQDASSKLVAAAEGSTYAPNLDAAPGLGSNEVKTSARSAIIPIINGPRGVGNPARQGLQSALLGEGDPLNINQDVPGRSNRYSPVWDVHLVVWTQAAINAGARTRLVSGSDVANVIQHGLATSGGSGPANKDLGGLRAAGFISNCPIVAVF